MTEVVVSFGMNAYARICPDGGEFVWFFGDLGVLVRCVSSLAASDDSNRNSTHCTCLSEIRLP